jgi:hypothetical protein
LPKILWTLLPSSPESVTQAEKIMKVNKFHLFSRFPITDKVLITELLVTFYLTMQKSVKSGMKNAIISEFSKKLKYLMPLHLEVTFFTTFTIK